MVNCSDGSVDWWASIAPLFKEYLMKSYLCDLWFICSDTIISAHKLVFVQFYNCNKKSESFLGWLEEDETFITLNDWTGHQVTQMLNEIYEADTVTMQPDTISLLKALGCFSDFRKHQRIIDLSHSAKNGNISSVSGNLPNVSDENQYSGCYLPAECNVKEFETSIENECNDIQHIKGKHLHTHKEAIDQKKYKICPFCKKSMRPWYYDKYHKRTCGPERIVFECSICLKSGFVNSITLKNHLRSMHSNLKPFKCNYCSKSFARSESLSKHRSRSHGFDSKGKSVSKKNISCNVCSKTLTSKSKLANHINVVHKEVKSFRCKFCEKSFGSKHNLTLHEGAIHTGNLPYKCANCTESFTRKKYLQKHILSHDKDKGFQLKLEKVQYVTKLNDVLEHEIHQSTV